MTCTAPDCDRDAERGELCRAHYEQRRRHPRAKFKPLRTSPGEAGKPILVSPTAENRSAFERAAKAEGLTVPRWLLEQGRKAVR